MSDLNEHIGMMAKGSCFRSFVMVGAMHLVQPSNTGYSHYTEEVGINDSLGEKYVPPVRDQT